MIARRAFSFAALATILFIPRLGAQCLSLSSLAAYTQNFDTLASTGTSSVVPVGWKFAESSTNANTTYTAGTGSGNAGDTYSFGASSSSERAFGGLQSGSLIPTIGACFSNDTGSTITSIAISYTGEQWRLGATGRNDHIDLQYSLNASSLTTGTWVDVHPLDFIAPISGPTVGALDGNASANRRFISGSITSLTVPTGTSFWIRWNDFNASGADDGLAVDNFSLTPTGVVTFGVTGMSSPSTVNTGGSTLLTASVTNATGAASVSGDLSSIGGASSEPFFDDGTNGDITGGDNIFSFAATIANDITAGQKSIPISASDSASPPHNATATITLTVSSPTNPSGVGTANPSSVQAGGSVALTVNVTPGTSPASTGLAVSADLSAIGGSSSQAFVDAGNNKFTFQTTVGVNTTPGSKTLPVTITDAQTRSGGATISLTVDQPPPPNDHVIISQIFGGGGNASAPYNRDFIELFNPTTQTFNVGGWSVQYASATGTSWQVQPLAGTIAPGEYYLIALGSGSNGANLPEPNVSGEILMGATAGKVALANNATPLTGCPIGSAQLVDLVGYGTTSNCNEGGAPASAPSNTTAIFRKGGGTIDTNNNGSDFVSGAPDPRRTAPIAEVGPAIVSTDPTTAGTNAPRDASITLNFSEPVDVDLNSHWFAISCSDTSSHESATFAHSGKSWVITPNVNFLAGESCSVTIFKDFVHDSDLDDGTPGTDSLAADYSWSFTVATGAPPPYPASVHLTMGNPSNAVADVNTPTNYLMSKPEYALSYNRDRGGPNWVSWHLSDEWQCCLTRFDTFRPDPAVSPDWYRVQAFDFFNTGFDRGHMTPNADRNRTGSDPIQQATFLMSNMIPQAPANNQGPWGQMEQDLRDLLPANELYIVAGGAGVGGTGSAGFATTVANGHVTVPASTWKVALVLPKGENDLSRVTASTRTIAVIMPNSQTVNSDWTQYLTTVDAVETLTGYDLFANVPDAIENAIEAGKDGVNPPGVASSSVSVDEDAQKTFTLDVASPNSNPLTYTILSGPSHGTLGGSDSSRTYTPAPDFNGTDTFTFRVSDGARTSNVGTVTITVLEANDPPTATDDAKSTDEDTTLTFSATELAANDSAGPSNEASQTLTVTAVSANANTHGPVALIAGQVVYFPDLNFNGVASFSYTVCDNGVTAGLSDSKCATATVNLTVNAVNDPPIASIVAPTTATEWSGVTVSANVTDPDANESFTYAWTITRNGEPFATESSKAFTLSVHDNGSYVFSVIATDGAGATGSDSKSVIVTNVAPTITSIQLSATTIDENASVTLTGNFSDPGATDTHTVTVNWGDGTAASSIPLPAGVLNFSFTHQYLDDAPTGTASDPYTISVTVTDNDGGVGGATTPITVNNVAPGIASVSGPTAALQVGSAATINVGYSDVGSLDTHSAIFAWDDGSSSVATCAAGTCTASHAFTSAGIYGVAVTLSDDDGGVASAKFDYVVVVDPNAGFVTGGGWINAPGKVSFAFVSKYQKGDSTPSGNTELQIQASKFNFNSSSMDWLVVAGSKAQYGGTGTVNGSGTYGFLLTVVDGDVSGGGGIDKFRIRIWDKSSGATAFDHVAGASDDIDDANPQPIGGGSIVIHK